MSCWKYSSGRPATPVLASAWLRNVLPLRGVVQMRYDVVGEPYRYLIGDIRRIISTDLPAARRPQGQPVAGPPAGEAPARRRGRREMNRSPVPPIEEAR